MTAQLFRYKICCGRDWKQLLFWNLMCGSAYFLWTQLSAANWNFKQEDS